MNEIPIKNIYYLVLYAWNKVQHKNMLTDTGLDQIKDINSLLIELFLNEVKKITRKGLYGDYVADDHDSIMIKGKVNINQSIYLIPPKMNCNFDEFQHDNHLNRLLKASLNYLYFTNNITEENKKEIRQLLLSFEGVPNQSLHDTSFQRITYNRLNQDYRFPIELAQLLYKNAIPLDEKENTFFIDILQDKETMSAIFEEFLRNFYKIHTDYQVRSRRHSWDLKAVGQSDIYLLPQMATDLEIEVEEEKLIIDAKYYQDAFQRQYGNKKFISAHMYQMNAYLQKQKYLITDKNLRGLLVYPSNGYEFHEKYLSQEGYTIEFKTINLNQDWKKIEEDLLSIF